MRFTHSINSANRPAVTLRRLVSSISLVAAGLCLAPSLAYEITGSKWRDGSTEFYVSIDGASPSGVTWQDSFLAAIADWDESTVFDFDVIEQKLDPCLEDGLNSVDFTDDVCGSAYGSSTLAVTLRRYFPTLLGEADLYEADIVINSSVNYDVYDGMLYPPGNRNIDFRRVAIHELGHVLGLEHEPREPAIMAPTIGDIDRPTEDDIEGVNRLYTALQSCVQTPLAFGSLSGSLAPGDCTVDQITGGGTDDSYIDIYRIDLANDATLKLSMQSSSLDSVLLIADLSLDILAFDSKTAEGCSSTLSQQLAPGSYLVLANTFDVQNDELCVTEGDYTLDAHYQSGTQLSLGGALSTSDVVARGQFSGAASINNGLFYKTRFGADEAITVAGTITVAEQDVGEEGFILVAALAGDQVFALNSDGIFEERLPNSGQFPKYARGPFPATLTITMLDDVVPSSLGITKLDVDFLIGYGLDSDPETVFYNQLPIKMAIFPDSL